MPVTIPRVNYCETCCRRFIEVYLRYMGRMRILLEEQKIPASGKRDRTLLEHFELAGPGEGFGAVFCV